MRVFSWIALIAIPILGFSYCMLQSMEPRKYQVEIDQQIGGKLICDVLEWSDLHGYGYQLDYTYESPSGMQEHVGYGDYYSREWKRNEQLLKIGDALLLVTGNRLDGDMVLVKVDNSWSWISFSPKEIESQQVWKQQGIKVLNDYWPQEAFVQKVAPSGEILVRYRFRERENDTTPTEKILHYELESHPLNVKLTKVTDS